MAGAEGARRQKEEWQIMRTERWLRLSYSQSNEIGKDLGEVYERHERKDK